MRRSVTGVRNMAEGKLCTVCGMDVAKRPRVKDARGRYFCEPCFAKTQVGVGSGGAGSASAAHPTPVPPVSTAAANSAPAGVIPEGVVGRGESGRLVMRRAAPKEERIGIDDGGLDRSGDTWETCPDCAMPVRKEADVCLACGFNRKLGRPMGRTFDDATTAPKRWQKNCQQCGYSLEGLRTAKCPECGHVNVPKSKNRFERLPRRITRWSYLAPLIVIGAWAVLQVVLDMAGWGSMIRGGAFIVVVTMLGVPLYWALNVFYVDNEDKFPTLALGTVAAYVGADILTSLIIGGGGAVGLALYYWLFLPQLVVHALWQKPLLDLEWKEAFVIAIPAVFISIAATVIGVIAAA